MIKDKDKPTATAVAQIILDEFNLHYWLFREYALKAREHFERGEWEAQWETSRARIEMYDQRVNDTVAGLRTDFPQTQYDELLWHAVKHVYIQMLYQHLQPECAETFFNSVACRVLHRSNYQTEYLFWRPAVSTEHLEGDEPSYRCYSLAAPGLRGALRGILGSFGFTLPFEDLHRDLRLLLRAVRLHPLRRELRGDAQVQVLSAPFFRGRAAYLLGRIVSGGAELPFAVPIRCSEAGRLYIDALLLEAEHISTLFSLARAYFLTDMQVPAAYVTFLSSLMPRKTRAELYTALGLHKHGKTLFYRDLQEHLKRSTDRFEEAPGVRGMVMLVFTLPSFPFVFKVIRDEFAAPKNTSDAEVRSKYRLVKLHDRVGRLSDAMEYSDVALPRARFSPKLLCDLEQLAGQKLDRNEDRLVIRHVYIERRMVPLDLFVASAAEESLRRVLQDFGDAIRDLASVNIFPGDLLPKNFGVTRAGRVVFYDYDEVCYLTECNFRAIPAPRSYDDELSGEPYYSVGPADVFPEQFATFLFPPGRVRDLFLTLHADLLDPAFWRGVQARAGRMQHPPPYPAHLRFRQRL